MVLMGVRNILFSIILLHACTATLKGSSVSSFEQTNKPNDDESSTSDELGSGLSVAESSVSNFKPPQQSVDDKSLTQMPTDSDCIPPSPSFFQNGIDLNSASTYNSSQCLSYGPGGFVVFKKKNPALNNNITLEAAAFNTKHAPTPTPTFDVLDESADFLKGPIVTRLMPSFYIIIILISLPLNTLALVTFTCRIREKKPAVIYMSHLACVDLLFTLLLPLKIHYQLNASDWVFGEALCRVLSAAYYCYMYCSILLMMCMSVDRLLAVVFPIASLTWRSTRKATCVCVLVWLLALAATVPLLLMRQTFKIEKMGMICHDALLQNDPMVLYYVYLFSILSCLCFFLPLVITFVSYSTIIYALSAKSDRLTSSSSDSRRRAVIMAIAVLVEFVVCFAPTNGILLYHCVHLANGGHREGDSSYAAYLLASCLGSASVFLDPLLYYYGSSQCRKQIRSVFWCKKSKKKNIHMKSSHCTTATQ